MLQKAAVYKPFQQGSSPDHHPLVTVSQMMRVRVVAFWMVGGCPSQISRPAIATRSVFGVFLIFVFYV